MKTNLKKCFFFALLLLFTFKTFSIYSQTPEWLAYFSNLNVLFVETDNNYVWAGSHQGIQRIDRITGEVEFFNKANSPLPHNFTISFLADGKGNIWIGTFRWPAKFDGSNWEIFNMGTSQLPHYIVYDMAVDSSGNIWFATREGLAKYNGTGLNGWEVFRTNNSGLPENELKTVEVDKSGIIWIGTRRSGLVRFDDKNWKLFDTSNSEIPSDYIQDIVIDSKNNLWISTSASPRDKLILYDGLNFHEQFYKPNYIDINGMDIDSKDNLWIVYGRGLAKYDGTDWTVYDTTNSGLPGKHVSSLAIDIDDNIWIGFGDVGGRTPFDGIGVTKFDGLNWKHYNLSNSGLPSNSIRDIVIDKNEIRWIGTYKGISKFDGINWSTFNSSNSSLPVDNINCMAVDSSNNLWAGTDSGLVKFDGLDWNFYNTENSKISNNEIRSLSVNSLGILWIGTEKGGLIEYDGEEFKVYNKSNSTIPSNKITYIVFDKEDNLWIRYVGLAKYNGEEWIHYVIDSGIKEMFSMAIDKSDNFWFGTRKKISEEKCALVKFDKNNWIISDESPLGYGNEISSIATDSNENIWVGTLNGFITGLTGIYPTGGGLSKFKDNKWTIFSLENSGIIDYRVTSIYIDKHNNKWIGTKNGLSVYREGGVIGVTDVEESYRNELNFSSCYPNPFSESTTIKYHIEKPGFVRLSIFNALGNEITTLFNGCQEPGEHQAIFNAKNTGNCLPSGAYFYKLQIGENVKIGQMLLLR